MRWLRWGMLVLVLAAAVGCGSGPTAPVEKTDPMPRNRFPQPDR